MKFISFELTMPNRGSWNGKWSGENFKYYIVKKVSDKFFEENKNRLLGNWYYTWNDGWSACVEGCLIDAKEAQKRRKISKGFAGYDWMVDSILLTGMILNSTELREYLNNEGRK